MQDSAICRLFVGFLSANLARKRLRSGVLSEGIHLPTRGPRLHGGRAHCNSLFYRDKVRKVQAKGDGSRSSLNGNLVRLQEGMGSNAVNVPI